MITKNASGKQINAKLRFGRKAKQKVKRWMIEIGKYYKPSILSFEDKDTVIQVDAIRCGRVEYTNVKTKYYDSMLIEEFTTYYEEAEGEGTGSGR